MAAFSNFDMASLIVEAHTHDKVLVEQELQPYNDFLYKIISDEIRAKHDDIMAALKTKIRDSPTKIRSVAVPLWSYNVRYFNKSRAEFNATMGEMAVGGRMTKLAESAILDQVYEDNGWHWKIGAEFDGLPDWTAPTIYDNLPMVPVDLIVRKTDLLARLSTLFLGNGWIRRVYEDILHEDGRCTIRKITLMVEFYPDGLPQGYQTRGLQAAKEKYATHVNYKVQDDHRVVLRGPGRAPPYTPPTSVVSTPEAPRRKRCDTCDAVEVDE
jgi:hypothetical protein